MHRDPTFDEVARREAKSCHGCYYRKQFWGVLFCDKNKWSGVDNEKRCEQWSRDPLKQAKDVLKRYQLNKERAKT